VFRRREHVIDSLQAILRVAEARNPRIKVRIEQSRNAYDAEPVISAIQAFRPSVEVVVPSDLNELSKWILKRHGKRIILHSRAIGAAKKSRYGDVNLVYAALDLLGYEYWEMRTAPPENSNPCRERFNTRLRELGLELSTSISSSRAGEEGDDYFVKYPVGTEQKRMLDYHLRKGSDRDEQFCLRIYFFWDQEVKKVVVGWLPNHLGTRAT
jgi:hypothetical protein